MHKLDKVSSFRTLATCGMVMSEVGRGLRLPNVLKRYQDVWGEMLVIQSTPEVWDRTLELVWTLDRQGIVLPIQDVHIAACALEVSAVVLTYDRHFKLIPDLVVTDCLY
ncbi:MAG: PIN domain-containing protein, partial [Kiritimatiellia bacterium]